MGKKHSILALTLAALPLILAGPSGFARTAFDDTTGATVQTPENDVPSDDAVQEQSSDQTKVETPAVHSVRKPANDSPEAEAEKFFRRDGQRDPNQSNDSGVGPENHYLAIGVGGYLTSDAYQWGQTPHDADVGRLMGQLTYRIAPLSSLADWALRADLIGYHLPEGNATQLAVSPVLMFPDSGSKFPLYFGLGAGPGVFLSQISQESFLSLNYQVFAGIRFFNVLDTAGFYLETGLKNQFLILTDGQLNGVYLTVGTVFMF